MNAKQKKIVAIVAIAGATLTLAACAGLDFGDVVKVDTPRSLVDRDDLPARLSVNAAEVEYERWLQTVQIDAKQWAAEIEKGGESAAMLASITMSGIDVLGPAAAGVPYVGALLPALTGLAGVAVGKRRVRKEKEASYRAGLEELAKLAGVSNGEAKETEEAS